MIKIGDQKLDTNILLAPLSGCTDLSFRLIAREHGAGFCFFEMADSNSIHYNSRKYHDILMTNENDFPIAAQLVGGDPDVMVSAAKKLLSEVKVSFIDINAACPVRKIIKKKAGAYLLHDTKALFQIIRKLSLELPLPITVKIRTGYRKNNIAEIVNLAKNCERSGASALFVHGRTKLQGYAGDIDYASIKAIKQSVNIPVFGSGNILDPVTAKRMFDETNCDGITVARGALGNPWIFKNIENYLKTGEVLPEITLTERKKVLKKHLAYLQKYKETSSLGKIGFYRKTALWYIKTLPDASKLRKTINCAETYEGILDKIDLI